VPGGGGDRAPPTPQFQNMRFCYQTYAPTPTPTNALTIALLEISFILLPPPLFRNRKIALDVVGNRPCLFILVEYCIQLSVLHPTVYTIAQQNESYEMIGQ